MSLEAGQPHPGTLGVAPEAAPARGLSGSFQKPPFGAGLKAPFLGSPVTPADRGAVNMSVHPNTYLLFIFVYMPHDLVAH